MVASTLEWVLSLNKRYHKSFGNSRNLENKMKTSVVKDSATEVFVSTRY